MNGVGQSRLDAIIAAYAENNYCVPREFKYKIGHGRNQKALDEVCPLPTAPNPASQPAQSTDEDTPKRGKHSAKRGGKQTSKRGRKQ